MQTLPTTCYINGISLPMWQIMISTIKNAQHF